jgi:hypothetical protein
MSPRVRAKTKVLISTLVLSLTLTSCSDRGKSDEPLSDSITLKISELCAYVTETGVNDLYNVRRLISELVQEDSSYLPLLEEIANFFSVMRERNTTGPKKYPDLQLLKTFCLAPNSSG